MRLYQLPIIIMLLTGCATSYGPAGEIGGFDTGGYADKRINANTVAVSFSGNWLTKQNTIRAYVLYRCAKITIENGYDYFIVTSSSISPVNVSVKTGSKNYLTIPPKLYDIFYTKTDYRSYRLSASRAAKCYPCNQNNQHAVVVVIKMFEGKAPDIPNAFDANDVIAHLGPATL